MFESAQTVSVMNSNFYCTEVNVQMNFHQNSSQLPQTTSSSYAPPSDFYYGFGSMLRIPSPDPQNIEGIGESASIDGDRGGDDSGQNTLNRASTPTSNFFSKCDPGRAIKSALVAETFDKYSEPSEGPSRAPYSGYILPPSPPSHTASFPFDRIAFKMDIEELKARMKETKPDMHYDDSNESASQYFPEAQVERELSLPRVLSSDDITTLAQPRPNTNNFSEAASRRPEEGLYISSPSLSTRRSRRSRTPKHYDRLISHLSGDASELMLASSASSGPSRDLRDDVHGRSSSACSIAVTPRRTPERGSRRGLPSRRGCLL